MHSEAPPTRGWIYPLALIGFATVGWFAILFAIDAHFFLPQELSLQSFWSSFQPDEVQGILGNFPEVVVAVLGIAITVVSIVLQLSATRYTPRVTELFFRDRTNLIVMGFFVVTSVHCIWATVATHQRFFPRAIVFSTLAMMTVAVLALIPYFVYVFEFLNPRRVVAHLQEQSLRQALGKGAIRRISQTVRQTKVVEGVEQLADVAVNAIQQKDRLLASGSVDALRDLIVRYMPQKSTLEKEWFAIGKMLQDNADFMVMSSESVQHLSRSHNWLEWKVLRQYQVVFSESVNRMLDVSERIAINTRTIGENALRCQDPKMLSMVLKYFNTYLRITINRKDVRTGYNVFDQYRQLAESLLYAGWKTQVLEVAEHFKYYGQIAHNSGLSFLTETAAYDLGTLCEVAHAATFTEERSLLNTLLEVDKAAETEAEERSLRGVRKAQIKLATYYLVQNAIPLARTIWKDMEHERHERLIGIRDELLAIKDREFWEVIDRGHNFEYLEPARRAKLATFFSWFGSSTLVPEV